MVRFLASGILACFILAGRLKEIRTPYGFPLVGSGFGLITMLAGEQGHLARIARPQNTMPERAPEADDIT